MHKIMIPPPSPRDQFSDYILLVRTCGVSAPQATLASGRIGRRHHHRCRQRHQKNIPGKYYTSVRWSMEVVFVQCAPVWSKACFIVALIISTIPTARSSRGNHLSKRQGSNRLSRLPKGSEKLLDILIRCQTKFARYTELQSIA